MGRPIELLILDDESLVGQRLKPALEKEGYRVEAFTEPREALARLEEKDFDIVVTDIRMEDLDGMEVLSRIRQKSPQTKVIMITGYATLELAHESLNKGAFDFIAKPFRIGTMRDTILKAAKALQDEKGPQG
ncbi:MAG: response regulator [Thermodesulfobacteriota bacterium]